MENKSYLIDGLYRSGIEKEIWSKMSCLVANYLDATNCFICIRQVKKPSEIDLCSFAFNESNFFNFLLDSESLQYLELTRSTQSNKGYDLSELEKLNPQQYQKIEENVFIPLGIAKMLYGSAYRDENVQVNLAVWREKSSDEFNQCDRENFEHLLDHVKNIHILQHRFALRSIDIQLMTKIINVSAYAQAICDADGELLFSNVKMSEVLKHGNILSKQNGYLKFQNNRHQSKLLDALQRVSDAEKEVDGLRIGEADHELFLTVTAVEPVISETLASSACLVSIFDCTYADNRQFYRSIFGLTEAESDIANRLAVGGTLSKIAEDKGLSKHTVRSQLKSLFQKTNTSSQNQLIALLNNAIPLIDIR